MPVKKRWDFGDVKFMGAIGLYYGVLSITEISLFAFMIASVVSIVVLIVRKFILKSKDEYIPFGPFLTVSAFSLIFIPANTIFLGFFTVCNGISNGILSVFT